MTEERARRDDGQARGGAGGEADGEAAWPAGFVATGVVRHPGTGLYQPWVAAGDGLVVCLSAHPDPTVAAAVARGYEPAWRQRLAGDTTGLRTLAGLLHVGARPAPLPPETRAAVLAAIRAALMAAAR